MMLCCISPSHLPRFMDNRHVQFRAARGSITCTGHTLVQAQRGALKALPCTPLFLCAGSACKHEHSQVTVPKAGISIKLACMKGQACPVRSLHRKQNKKQEQDPRENESHQIGVTDGDIGSIYLNFHTLIYYFMLSATFHVTDRICALPSSNSTYRLILFDLILVCFFTVQKQFILL